MSGVAAAAAAAGAGGPAARAARGRGPRRRRLGQHLLKEGAPAAALMVATARPGRGDSVLEVGAGAGALTGPLCDAAGSVVAYEADASILEEARARLPGRANLSLVHGDGFAGDPLACTASVFVSSLPYSQSRRAVEWLARSAVPRAVVMVQKEFAAKISGGGPRRQRRAVTVIARCAFDVRLVAQVGRGQFAPEPEVDSEIVELRRRAVLPEGIVAAVNTLFSHRRKSLRGALGAAYGRKRPDGWAEAAAAVADMDARLDCLSDEQIARIARMIASASASAAAGGGPAGGGPAGGGPAEAGAGAADICGSRPAQPAAAVARATEYAPAEDTFFLDDHIRGRSGRLALDIGSGSGYITRSLAASFETVVGTDISHAVLKGQTYGGPCRICCDGADALAAKFDLVVCNLPYLATDRIDDVATDGGPRGTAVPLRIIRSAAGRVAPGGSLLLVSSSLSDYAALIAEAERLGMAASVIARKRLFFEELVLIEAKRRRRGSAA